MRIFILLFLFIIKGYDSYCQKIEILEESGFKHNYVVSTPRFLEDPNDTVHLNFICEIGLSEEQTHLLTIAGWIDLIKIKAKALGANTYLVSGYSETEKSIFLKLRLYFAGEKFVKANKLKVDTNSVFVFNQTRFDKDTGTFYLNDVKTSFNAKKFFMFRPKTSRPCYLATNESNITSKKILFKKSAKSRFFIIPANKRTFAANRSKLNPYSVGVSINGVIVTFDRNSPYELNYETGRLLMSVYK